MRTSREGKMPMCHIAGERKPFEPALLDCQAKPSCGRWVRHIFKEVRHVEVDDADAKDGKKRVPAMEHVYVCEKCGAERRWGLS